MAAEHLKSDLEEEREIAGIVPAVEGERFDIYISIDDLYLFRSHARCALDQHLIALTEIDTHVFGTVLIAAAVVDTTGVDADGFLAAAVADHSIFCHNKSSRYKITYVRCRCGTSLL